MMTFQDFFRTATGNTPYDYQCRLACGDKQGDVSTAAWLEGGADCASKLIEIPTGLGKTAAVVLAWLWNRVGQPNVAARNAWPRRLVCCLPMRTLVEQTEKNVREWLGSRLWDGKSDHAGKVGLHILMGGEEKTDWDLYPEHDAILIGTQDMLLSRALNRGYGMSRYRWPMHFGSLNNDCLWVMDETQLMGPALWTSAQLDWMREARFRSQIRCKTWWMSATTSDEFLQTSDRIAEKFEQPPVFLLGDEPGAATQLAARRPCLMWIPPVPVAKPAARNKKAAAAKTSPDAEFFPSLAKAVVQQHLAGTLSLVICNTVAAAQETFQNARAAPSGNIECILLTSRFRRSDRKEAVQKLIAFEEQRKKGLVKDTPGLICISTQVVEAGVDVSSVRLWSEIAPWPSIVQRLGRLNRDGAENDRAQAFFFRVPSPDPKPKEDANIGPYLAEAVARGDGILKRLIALRDAEPTLSSRDAIERLSSEKTVGAEIRAALKPKPTPFPRAMDIHGLFSTEPDVFGGFTDISPFVRDATNRADAIIFWRDDSSKERFPLRELPGPPFDPGEGCAVSVSRLRKFLTDHARAFQWNPDAAGASGAGLGKWESIRPDDVCPGMVLMLPASAGGYDRTLGWTGNRKQRPANLREPGPFSERLNADPLSEKGDWLELGKHLAQTERIAEVIAKKLGLPPDLAKALTVAAALHDIGKSLPKWQEAVPKPRPNEQDIWAKFITKHGQSFRPNCRHEAASALALWHRYFRENADFPALSIYLTAAHHGKVRTVLSSRIGDGSDICGVPFGHAPLKWDGGMPMDFACALDGAAGEFSADGTRFVCDSSGWTALVVDVLGDWQPGSASAEPVTIRAGEPVALGPFALAFLESLLRAADMRASA